MFRAHNLDNIQSYIWPLDIIDLGNAMGFISFCHCLNKAITIILL